MAEILLQKTKDDIWSLPAGAVDPGEKPAQAIVREVFEETGLLVRPASIRGVVGGPPEYRITYPNGDVVESLTVVFHCAIVRGGLKAHDDETSRLEYFEPDQMPTLGVPYPSDFFTNPTSPAHFEWNEGWLAHIC